MWPVLMRAVQTYAPYIVFPVACTIGFIGYNIEDWVSDKHTPYRESAIERREKRREEEKDAPVQDLVPKTIFEKNISPSLIKQT